MSSSDFIFYSDHGGIDYAIFYSSFLTELKNSFINTKACLVGGLDREIKNKLSWSLQALRLGALGLVSSIDADIHHSSPKPTSNDIYYNNLNLGMSFVFNASGVAINTLLGDPTLNVNRWPTYRPIYPLE